MNKEWKGIMHKMENKQLPWTDEDKVCVRKLNRIIDAVAKLKVDIRILRDRVQSTDTYPDWLVATAGIIDRAIIDCDRCVRKMAATTEAERRRVLEGDENEANNGGEEPP